MKFSALGFTLVELLVVLAIMAIVGVFTLANYKSFGEDQKLKSAVLDIQSLLRQAQTNATTNVKCDTGYGARWLVTFVDATTFNLQCTENSSDIWLKKSSKLGSNITMQVASSLNCPDSSQLFSVSFAPLSNRATVLDYMYRDKLSCTDLTITLRNSKTQATKSLKIEQGGRIYGQ